MGTLAEVLVELDTTVERTCVELAVNLTAELTERTPVDTGWARANWIPALGAPQLLSGKPSGGDGDRIAQESGSLEILAFKLADGAIFVANGVPYIARLNAGWSTQAPAGFVELAIAATLDGARDGLGRDWWLAQRAR